MAFFAKVISRKRDANRFGRISWHVSVYCVSKQHSTAENVSVVKCYWDGNELRPVAAVPDLLRFEFESKLKEDGHTISKNKKKRSLRFALQDSNNELDLHDVPFDQEADRTISCGAHGKYIHFRIKGEVTQSPHSSPSGGGRKGSLTSPSSFASSALPGSSEHGLTDSTIADEVSLNTPTTKSQLSPHDSKESNASDKRSAKKVKSLDKELQEERKKNETYEAALNKLHNLMQIYCQKRGARTLPENDKYGKVALELLGELVDGFPQDCTQGESTSGSLSTGAAANCRPTTATSYLSARTDDTATRLMSSSEKDEEIQKLKDALQNGVKDKTYWQHQTSKLKDEIAELKNSKLTQCHITKPHSPEEMYMQLGFTPCPYPSDEVGFPHVTQRDQVLEAEVGSEQMGTPRSVIQHWNGGVDPPAADPSWPSKTTSALSTMDIAQLEKEKFTKPPEERETVEAIEHQIALLKQKEADDIPGDGDAADEIGERCEIYSTDLFQVGPHHK